MTAGTFRVPPPANEPVWSYAPGSPEREALQEELRRQGGEIVEIPCVIGGERVFTGRTVEITNPSGDILAGWLVSQMDIAGAIKAVQIAHSRVVTVAIERMHFLTSVRVGCQVSCYGEVVSVGRTSIRVKIEVWISYHKYPDPIKVTESELVYVSVNDQGQTQTIEQ